MFEDKYKYTTDTVEEVESKITDLKKKKRKLVFRKGLSATKCAVVGLAGSIIFYGVSILTMSLSGHSPFKRDDVERIAYYKTEFDSEGNKEVEKQYEPYEDMSSKVTYYSGWTDMGDRYASITTTYDLSNYNYDEAKGILSLKEHPASEPVEGIVFADDISDKKEGSYYEAVIYEQDSSDCILTPQTKEENGQDIEFGLGFPAIPGLVGNIVGVIYLRAGEYTPLDKFYHAKWDIEDIDKELNENKKLVKKLKNKKIS